jgi:hypothetical protein
VDVKKELKQKSQTINDATFDVDYSLMTVKPLHNVETFKNINTMLQSSFENLAIIYR